MAVRHDGDWESWLKFFLRGVFEVSQAASQESDKSAIGRHDQEIANGPFQTRSEEEKTDMTSSKGKFFPLSRREQRATVPVP
jgi:hypothetical protein